MTENVKSIWDSDVVKSFENEGSGGGGWIAWTNVQFGYKVFAKGYSNDETFFAFDIENENDKARAKAEANSFRDKYNENVPADDKIKAPTNAIRIEVDKNKVFNKDTSTWQGNRIQDTPVWTDAYKEIIFPNLRDAGADLGWQWARISFAKDPFKPTRVNQLTGEEVDNLVMYIAEVYLTKEEAVDAAAELASGSLSEDESEEPAQANIADTDSDGTGSIPATYDKESWEGVIPYIKEALAKGEQSPKEIADDYGVSVLDIMKLK